MQPGLIGFGALEKLSTSRVIFTDVSKDLLNHAQTIARDIGVLERCEFIFTSAEALSSIGDESRHRSKNKGCL
jgi:ubiquinone/menaquinone biosynthesis C-methylase UbiE